MATSSLRLYLGPMFSGKTSRLLADLTLNADLDLKVLLICSELDKREESKDLSNENDDSGVVTRKGISSHSSQFYRPSPLIKVVHTKKLASVDITGYDVVGIDEAHFYSDLLSTVVSWLDTKDREKALSVICAGLDGSSDKKPIGQILFLIPHADPEDGVQKCAAICKYCLKESCQKIKAGFTKRLVDDKSEICVGGKDKYAATCRKHHD